MESEIQPKKTKKKFILPALAGLIIYGSLKLMDGFSSASLEAAVDAQGPSGQQQSAQQIAGTKDIVFARQILPEIALPPDKIGKTNPPVNAGAYYALDVKTGYPLAAYNADQKKPFASTTKLMTAVISLENYQLDEVATVSRNAATQIGSVAGLRTGEKITIENLLKGLLLPSGNDAAMALAEHMGEEKFLVKMNEKAKLIGMKDTVFLSPSGLDDEALTTARDLAVLGSYSARFSKILEISQTKEATIFSVDKSYSHHLANSNRLIVGSHPLYLPYVQGLKTGFTPDAGHLLVTYSNKDNHPIAAVIMDASPRGPEASARESNRLIRWVYDSYKWD